MALAKKKFRLTLLTLVALLAAFTASSVNADTLYWSYGSNATWSTASGPAYDHWSDTSGVTGTLAWTNGDDAVLEGPGMVFTLSASPYNPTVGNITINAAGYSITGPTRTLNLDGDNSSTSIFTVNVNPSTTTPAVSSVIAGSANLGKAGTGTLTLVVANTYTGLTTVSAGTLHLRNSNSLGGTGVGSGTVVNDGGTLSLGDASVAVNVPAGEALTINGQGAGGLGALNIAVATTAHNSTYSGPVTLGSAARINCGSTNRGLIVADITTDYALTVGGVGNTAIASLVGSGSLVKDGVGAVTLTGIHSYAGDTEISAGTLSLAQMGLSDTADVKIAELAVLDLGFVGTDTINSLYLGGVQQAAGVYDATNSGGYITGSGSLTIVPEPNTLALLAVGLIGLLAYGWRQRKQ